MTDLIIAIRYDAKIKEDFFHSSRIRDFIKKLLSHVSVRTLGLSHFISGWFSHFISIFDLRCKCILSKNRRLLFNWNSWVKHNFVLHAF